MKRIVIFSAIAVWTLVAAANQCPGQKPNEKPNDASRASPALSVVHELYVEDQKDRHAEHRDASYWKGVNTRDAARRDAVKELIANQRVISGEDFYDAAVIYQHGRSAGDYLLAHILAMESMAKGYSQSKAIAAASLDRYLVMIKQSQVFGTQYLAVPPPATKAGGAAPPPTALDESATTQEPYDRLLVPDALRREFCVPNLKQQAANLAAFNASRDPEDSDLVPVGCTR